MKASEILRKLADMIDGHDSAEQEPQAQLRSVEVDNTDSTEQSVMVPPLQQKIELLKKEAGVESHYDDECGEEEKDELDVIRTNAGLGPVGVMIASDDEPLDM